MKEFFKWFLDTQLVKSKAPVWRDFFMNAITLKLILIYLFLTVSGKEVSNEFNMLLSMVLGFYFNHKHTSKDEDNN